VSANAHRTPDELRPLASVVTASPLAHTVEVRCNARDDCGGQSGVRRMRGASSGREGVSP
jgi:hypothetical protein